MCIRAPAPNQPIPSQPTPRTRRGSVRSMCFGYRHHRAWKQAVLRCQALFLAGRIPSSDRPRIGSGVLFIARKSQQAKSPPQVRNASDFKTKDCGDPFLTGGTGTAASDCTRRASARHTPRLRHQRQRRGFLSARSAHREQGAAKRIRIHRNDYKPRFIIETSPRRLLARGLCCFRYTLRNPEVQPQRNLRKFEPHDCTTAVNKTTRPCLLKTPQGDQARKKRPWSKEQPNKHRSRAVPFGLQPPQLSVLAAFGEEFAVATVFHKAAGLEHQDPVGFAHRGQAVGDQQCRTAAGQPGEV